MLEGLDAITFDCWGTLIFDKPEIDGRTSYNVRVEHLARIGDLSVEAADELLQEAWAHHHTAWHELRGYGSSGMAAHCLEALGMRDERRLRELTDAFEEASIEFGVDVVPDAPATIEALRSRGFRTALVCDTGFTPGRVVRHLLGEHGITPLLDVLAFSDEVGVPKPHERMFRTALDGIGVDASAAAHIGDLKRTDIAGGRAAGMSTIRFRGVYDDETDLPDADVVISEMRELPKIVAGRG
ncbi:MAG: HAD family hydrolase [Actinomycetota bacterium]